MYSIFTAGALICAYMMISLPKDTWVRLIVWTFFGMLVYFFYGRKHSVLGRRRA